MFTIAPASSADVLAAASVLASAFTNDTVMGTLIEGEHKQSRLARLFRALMRTGALRAGRIDLVRSDTDGGLLGAAIWEPPGQHASLLKQARELPGFLRALGWGGLGRAIRIQTTLAHHRPAEPHWYLAQIGVSADARGRGVGSALLESRLKKVDADGLPAYLEASNERNRDLYRRHGFESIAFIDGIPNASPAAMWRAARVGDSDADKPQVKPGAGSRDASPSRP